MKMDPLAVLEGAAEEPAVPSGDDLATYRRMAVQLNHQLQEVPAPRSVLVTAPTDASAPAHAAVALARCMGEELRLRVLLVDASPRAEVSRMMGCADDAGFAEMLDDPSRDLDGLLLATTVESVRLLPAGTLGGLTRLNAAADPSGVLQRLKDAADLIVISAGSVLGETAAVGLAPFASAVILVPVENETLAEDLDMAQYALRMCKARKIGILMASAAREGR
jgi:Mrp family chromosome partitioning ATPase